MNPVDHSLKSVSLGGVVVSPQRYERLVGVEQSPEVLEASLLVPERVALDVEEDVAGRGVGKQRKPALRERVEKDELKLAGVVALKLQSRLAVELLEGLWIDSGRGVRGGLRLRARASS